MDTKQSDAVARYREYAWFQFSMDGEGLGLREARECLNEAQALSQEVRELDEIVIEATQVNDYINPGLLEDDPRQPLAHWWWHLGKLRNRTYPASLLPEHLRAVYLDATDQAA
jgi:hypothetical protein